MIFLSTSVMKVAEGFFKGIGILCIFKAICIYAGQNSARGRGNGRSHCAVLKQCEGGGEAHYICWFFRLLVCQLI